VKIGVLALSKPAHGGVLQYTQCLLSALKLLNGKGYDIAIIAAYDFISVSEQFLDDFRVTVLPKGLVGRTVTTMRHYLGLKVGPRLLDFDLIVAPNISLLPFSANCPYVVTIHDFVFKYYPNFFPFYKRWIRSFQYLKAAKNAGLVICESARVKQDIVRFTGIPADKVMILVSPPVLTCTLADEDTGAASSARTPLSTQDFPARFLFCPANFWPHKNHLRLLQAIDYVRKVYGEEMPLILSGAPRSSFRTVMRAIKSMNLERLVRYVGYLTDREMKTVFQSAYALVLPSLFESVSLPVWEAFALGTPVLASRTCAVPEQVGEAGILFDPEDPRDIGEKIIFLWTHQSIRESLIQAGLNRVKELSLENYANQWKQVLGILAGKIGSSRKGGAGEGRRNSASLDGNVN
jgi:glycosyltransferase involved in cell wall biosynthesis